MYFITFLEINTLYSLNSFKRNLAIFSFLNLLISLTLSDRSSGAIRSNLSLWE